jgi:hypothetical protein
LRRAGLLGGNTRISLFIPAKSVLQDFLTCLEPGWRDGSARVPPGRSALLTLEVSDMTFDMAKKVVKHFI